MSMSNRMTMTFTLACRGVHVAVGRRRRFAFRHPAPPATSRRDPALARTREQVKMLDDLYKNAVVAITRCTTTAPRDPRRQERLRSDG